MKQSKQLPLLQRSLLPWVVGGILVFIFGHWLVVRFWFRYEDLGLFYLLQHPEQLAAVFSKPEAMPYRNQAWLLPWQFALFGYQPLPYIVMSVAMMGVALGVFTAWFSRLVKDVAVTGLTLVLLLSGIGVETLGWNVFNGFQTYNVIFLWFGALLALEFFRQGGRWGWFVLGAGLYALNVFLFPFRSFLVVAPMALYLLALPWERRRDRLVTLLAVGAVSVAGFLFVAQASLTRSGSPADILQSGGELFATALANIGAATLSLDRWVPNEGFARTLLYGLVALGVLGGGVLYGLRTRQRLIGRIVLYLTGALILNSILFSFAALLAGSAPTVYLNAHRFLTFLAYLALPLLAILGRAVYQRLKTPLGKGALVLAGIAAVGLNVAGTSAALRTRLEGENRLIKQFYLGLKSAVQTLPNGTVLLAVATAPRTIDPFTSGPYGPSSQYIAGLYGIPNEDFTLTHTLPDSIKALRQGGGEVERLAAVTYSRIGVEDRSEAVRALLQKGFAEPISSAEQSSPYDPANRRTEPIVLEGLQLPNLLPLTMTFEVRLTPAGAGAPAQKLVGVWWQRDTAAQWREAWSASVTVPADGAWHRRTVTVPWDEGFFVTALRFGPLTEPLDLSIRNVSAAVEAVDGLR